MLMGATVASCATLEGTVGLQRPVRGPAGCRQQQLRLVSRVGGASYQQLPSTPHSLPAQLHATHKGWGGGLKSWLSMAVPQHWLWSPTEFSMRYIGAKTGWKWPAFAECPWQGQGYTALLLPRRRDAGPQTRSNLARSCCLPEKLPADASALQDHCTIFLHLSFAFKILRFRTV